MVSSFVGDEHITKNATLSRRAMLVVTAACAAVRPELAAATASGGCLHAAKAVCEDVPLADPNLQVRLAKFIHEVTNIFALPSGIMTWDFPNDNCDVASVENGCSAHPYRLHLHSGRLQALERALDESALRYVVYHEVTHVLQFRASPNLSAQYCSSSPLAVKPYELLADCGAGYAMAAVGKDLAIRAAGGLPSTIAELSDYDFGDSTHHGTVSERVSAFGLGMAIYSDNRALRMDLLCQRLDRLEEALFLPPGLSDSLPAQQEAAHKRLEDLYR